MTGRRVILEQKLDGSGRGVTRVRAADGSFSTYLRPADAGYRSYR